MAFHLEVVTAERSVFSDTVDEVVAPGVDGEFGVLSNHEPFLTALNFGELRIKRAGGELDLALGGVVVLGGPQLEFSLVDQPFFLLGVPQGKRHPHRHRVVVVVGQSPRGVGRIARNRHVEIRSSTQFSQIQALLRRLNRRHLAHVAQESPDALEVIKWKELYETMEAVTDRCEDVANLLEGVVLKHA